MMFLMGVLNVKQYLINRHILMVYIIHVDFGDGLLFGFTIYGFYSEFHEGQYWFYRVL